MKTFYIGNSFSGIFFAERRLFNVFATKLAAVLGILFLPITSFLASETNGLEILREANTNMGAVSFKADFYYVAGSDEKIYGNVMQDKMDDGKLEARKEIIAESEGFVITNIYVLNANGFWHITHNSTLRLDYLRTFQDNATVALFDYLLDLNVHADYMVESNVIDGKSLLVVTQIKSPSPTPSENKTLDVDQIKRLSIYVDASTHFLYGFKYQKSNGGISEMRIKDYSFTNFSESDFTIPYGLPQVICTTKSQFIQSYLSNTIEQTMTTTQIGEHKAFMEGRRHYRTLYLILLAILVFSSAGLGWLLIKEKK